MALNFAQALMEAKRRAQLSGRPLSRQEAAGIAEGFAESASDRLARAKQLSLQEQQMGTQAGQFERDFAFRSEQAVLNQKNIEEQRKAEEKAGMIGTAVNVGTTAATLYALKGMGGKSAASGASKGLDAYMAGKSAAAAGTDTAAGAAGGASGMSGAAAAGYTAAILGAEALTSPTIEEQWGTTAKHTTSIGAYTGAGAVAGTSVAPGYGTVIGGAIGAILGIGKEISGSYLCTETKKRSGIEQDGINLLKMFKNYADKNHKGVLEFYLRIGPRLVKAIAEREGEFTKQFYDNLKVRMVGPVIELTRKGNLETAFQLYQKTTLDLIFTFTPELYKEAETVVKIDEGLKEAA